MSASAFDTYLVYKRPANFKFNFPAEKKFVWIEEGEGDDRHYVAAEVLKQNEKDMVVRVQDNSKEKTVNIDDTQPVNPSKFDGVDDCAMLGHLSQAAVLYNLKLRYDANVIYTYSGLFLVAINPYKWYPIYTQEIISRYVNRRKTEIPPHVYASADEAYRALLKDKRSQSMLVTGESGAGKTENTKKIIQYLASVGGRSGSEGLLEKKLLQANPLLEALGNAKTLKNNNSSRFGKFIKITFESTGYISGSSIVSYLLERSRVVARGNGERSFHIFYQLIASLPPQMKKQYLLTEPEDYKYLTQSNCTTVNGMDDVKEFNDTKLSLDTLEFSKEEQDSMFRVVAGILHLGNVEFSGDEQAVVKSDEPIKSAAELWKVDAEALKQALISPRITVGREKIKKGMTPFLAERSRDALAKAIYGRMFLWVVSKINDTLQVKPKENFIGILDIAGFEIFEHNSFEQLCINFTNERLQQFFNNHMFHLEQEEYRKEKIEWTFVNFGVDSQATIDLICKKPKGILILLDEECVVPKATDETFVDKLCKTHLNRNPKFKKERLDGALNFSIEHYAGKVTYDASLWLEKNKDPLQEDIQLCITNSKDKVIVNFFNNFGQTSTKGASFNTVGTVYRNQLDDLLDTLGSTNPHFVRCIIPNHKQVAGVIDDSIVLDQLACNGVLEGIRISRLGFPNRMIYSEFHKRYYLLDTTVPKTAPDAKAATKKILDKLVSEKVLDPERFRYGVTKIFFRTGELSKVEEAREKLVGDLIRDIQACIRGFIGRKVYERIRQRKQASLVIQKNIRGWLQLRSDPWWELFAKLRSKAYQEMARRDQIERELKEKLDAIVAQITKTEEEKAKTLEGAKKLETDIESIRHDIDTKQRKIAEKSEEIEDVRKECKDLDKDVEIMREMLREREKDLRKEEENAQVVIDKIRQVQNKDKDESEACKKLDTLINTDKATLQRLQNEIEKEKINVEDLNRVKADLENKLDMKRDDLQRLHEKKAGLQKDKTDLEDLVESRKNTRTQILNDSSVLEKKIEGLEGELKTFIPIFEQTTDKRKTADTLSKKLEQNISTLNNELNNEQIKGTKLQGEIKILQGDSNRTKLDVDDAKLRLKDTIEILKKTTEEFEVKTSALNSTIEDNAKLSEKKAITEKHNAELKGRLDDANIKIDKLTKDNAILSEECLKLTESIEEVENNMSKIDKSIFKTTVDLHDLEDKTKAFQTVGGKAGKSKASLESKLNELKRNLDELKLKHTKETESNKKSNEEKTKLQTEYETVKAEKDQTIKQRDSLTLNLRELENTKELSTSDINSISKKILLVQKNKAEIKTQRELLVADKNALLSSREYLESMLVDVKLKKEEASEAHKRLNEKLKNMESNHQSLSNELETKDKDRIVLDKKITKLEEELLGKKKEFDKAQADLELAQKQSNQLESEIKKEQSKINTLMNESEALDKKIKVLENEVEDRKKDVDKQTSENNELDREVKQLFEKNEDLKNELDIAIKAKQRAKQSISDVERLIEEKKEALANAKNQEIIDELRGKLNLELRELDEDLTRKTKEKEKLFESIREIHNQIESAHNSLDNVKTEIEFVDRDRKNYISRYQMVNKELSQLSAENNLLEQKIAAVENKIAKANGTYQPRKPKARKDKKKKRIVKKRRVNKTREVHVPFETKEEKTEQKDGEGESESKLENQVDSEQKPVEEALVEGKEPNVKGVDEDSKPVENEVDSEQKPVEAEKPQVLKEPTYEEYSTEEEYSDYETESEDEAQEEPSPKLTQQAPTKDTRLRELKEEIRALNNEIKNDRRACSHFERQSVALETELAHLKQTTRDYATSNTNARLHAGIVQDEVDILKGSLLADEEITKTIQQMIQDNDQEILDLKDRLKKKESERDESEDKYAQLRRDLVKIKVEVDRETHLAQVARNNLHKANAKLTTAITDERAGTFHDGESPLVRVEKHETVQAIRRETLRVLKTIKKLRGYLTTLMSEKEEQDKITWQLQEEAEELKKDAHQMYLERVNSEKEREYLHKQTTLTQEFVKDTELQFERSKRYVSELNRDIDRFRDKIATLEDSSSQLEKYREKGKRLLKNLETELEFARQRREVANEEKLDADFNKKKLRKKLMHEQIHHKEAESDNAKIEENLMFAKTDYRIKKADYSNMERTRESLNQDWAYTQQAISTQEKQEIFDTDKVRLEKQVEYLKQEIKEAKEKTKKLKLSARDEEDTAEKLHFDIKTLRNDLNRMRIRASTETKARDQMAMLLSRLESGGFEGGDEFSADEEAAVLG